MLSLKISGKTALPGPSLHAPQKHYNLKKKMIAVIFLLLLSFIPISQIRNMFVKFQVLAQPLAKLFLTHASLDFQVCNAGTGH